jgi:hypothetical protein
VCSNCYTIKKAARWPPHFPSYEDSVNKRPGTC